MLSGRLASLCMLGRGLELEKEMRGLQGFRASMLRLLAGIWKRGEEKRKQV